ncbi:uncharacterized protein LOC117323844 [Pecten maximus]|uniref:uncharacterized protein LOC117323844 n=1 Tax=Pecten maximus TaxID=6579 RepID=UPI001458EB54|nr:uncharacterized protein LOC117323844 [Pecten maximus]
MGVDLAVYRVRIGKFVHRNTEQGLSNIVYLLKAIASVRQEIVRICRWKGTVSFIQLLLLAQGVEPNPGPQVKDEQAVAAGGSDPDTVHVSRETLSKIVSDLVQGGKTETMMSARPQGEASGKMMSARLQGEASGTMLSAHPQGEASGTMMSVRPQREATGTMMLAHPQGEATGTMMPACPQGEAILMQYQEQNIRKLNVSFPGAETGVLDDNNTINITKSEMDDETKATLKEFNQTVKTMNQWKPQQKPLESSSTQSNIPTSKESSTRQTKHRKEDREVSATRKHLEGK